MHIVKTSVGYHAEPFLLPPTIFSHTGMGREVLLQSFMLSGFAFVTFVSVLVNECAYVFFVFLPHSASQHCTMVKLYQMRP